MQEIRLIDRGGFGVVHEVVDRKGAHLARKSFDPQVGSAEEKDKLLKRFKREVQIQSRINHPKTGYLLHSGDYHGLWSWLLVTRRCQAVGMHVADLVGPNRRRASTRAAKIAAAGGAAPQTPPVRTAGVFSRDVTRIGPFPTTRSWGYLS